MTVSSAINGTAAGTAPADRRLRTAAPQSGFAPWKDPTKTPIIRFENVTKRFGDFVAVKDMNLNVIDMNAGMMSMDNNMTEMERQISLIQNDMRTTISVPDLRGASRVHAGPFSSRTAPSFAFFAASREENLLSKFAPNYGYTRAE